MEASALGVSMRESGVWTYAIVNLFHILGVATLFGSILILDLRLMGVGRQVAIAELSRITVPVAKVGFAVAVTTGVALLATNATDYSGNPFFLIKFPAIAVALLNVWLLSQLPAWRARGQRELTHREHRQLAVVGGMSLASWFVAVAAGRMIGYW